MCLRVLHSLPYHASGPLKKQLLLFAKAVFYAYFLFSTYYKIPPQKVAAGFFRRNRYYKNQSFQLS